MIDPGRFSMPREQMRAAARRGKRGALSLYRVSDEVLPLQAVADRLGTSRTIAAHRIRAARSRGKVTWEALA